MVRAHLLRCLPSAVDDRNWYQPLLSGDLPCPRSGYAQACGTRHHSSRLSGPGWLPASPESATRRAAFNQFPARYHTLGAQAYSQPSVTLSPYSRRHSATVVGDSLVIFGGWDQPEVFNDVYSLDLATMEFARLELSGTPPSPRSWHAAVLVRGAEEGGGGILIQGGYDGETALSDAFLLDLGARRWTEVTPALFPTGRAGHAGVVHDGCVHLYGGGDNEGRYFDALLSRPVSEIL